MYKAFNSNKNGKEIIYLNGKSIKGDWVYGYILKIPYNKTDSYDYYMIEEMNHRDSMYDIYRYTCDIIPETICEAIPGLKDKFNKQVFNHDRITLHPMFGVCEVGWNENQCRYDLYLNGHPVAGFNQDTIKNYEVVGTIFDKEPTNDKT